MIQGDRNTSFYHLSTLTRRKRNHIASVKDDMGEWITSEREVMKFFSERVYFLIFHLTCGGQSSPFSTPTQWYGRMSEEVKCSLSAMVTIEEIKSALWSMKPYKAPGLDVLHAGFFQRFWLITGDSVKREVERTFTSARVPDYLNKTFIALIPKI